MDYPENVPQGRFVILSAAKEPKTQNLKPKTRL
jgi:hypothetical protein